MEAAAPGDRVWLVDGASTDGSPQIAASLGAEVIPAPLGKGRAMATAIARCESRHICFMDADLEYSSSNIPLRLREAHAEEPADMIVAEFEWPAKRFLNALPGVYRPLVGSLFPEALERFGRMPFSGFRVLRTDLPLGSLPPGFAVETYLNLLCTVRGMRTRVIDVGVYGGPDRPKRELGREVGEVILDMAEGDGRLDARLRPLWETWLEEVMEVLRTHPSPGEPTGDYPERLAATASRPLPPRTAGGDPP
jgi:glucosyl-3-phosphoglycerate synthase